MKRIAKRAAIGAALLSLLGLTGWYGWSWWQRSCSTEATDNAYVHADITAISPKVAGYVADVLVGDNQVIEAGAILVRIADEDYRAQRDRAQAAVAEAEAAIVNLARRKDLQRATVREAEATIELARADVELTRRDLGRSRQLVSQGWTPRSRHDEATARAERAHANLAKAEAATAAAREQLAVLDSEVRQAEAQLMEARASLQLAEIALSETAIRAPLAGVVGNRRVQTGEYVRPGGMLLSIVPIEGVWVVANFKETEVARMRIGQSARITVDGYSDVAIDGRVDSLAPASGAAFSLLPPDNATGNFVKIVQRVPVKIRLQPNHALLGRLVPGMSAHVTVDVRSGASDATHPASSLQTGSSLFRQER
jgi:membrane fusion protein (multidrug efflux system)